MLAHCPHFAVQDDAGNIVDDATITVTREATGALAVPYADKDGVTGLGNPYVAPDGADPGFYAIGGFYRIDAAKTGMTTRTWRDVPVGLAAGTDEAVAGDIVTYTDADVSGGAITIPATVGRAYINCTTPVNVNLSASADRDELDLEMIDVGGFGFTPVCSGAETINGAAASGFGVTTPRGWLKLAPRTLGYVIRGAQF